MGLLDTIKEIKAKQDEALLSESVANEGQDASVADTAKKSLRRSGRTPTSDSVVGAAHVRRGENSMSSRPFQYKNVFGLLGQCMSPDDCRVEIDVIDEFTKSMRNAYPDWAPMPKHQLIPLALDLLPHQCQEAIKSVGFVADRNPDLDEINHARKALGLPVKSMGSLDYSAGGSLVPNPAHGDLIRLARNTPGLFAAGAQTYPIPPQGSIEFPRILAPTAVEATDGEGDTTDETELVTDSMKLEAKMISGIVTLSNKLIMMSTPAADTIVQEDLIMSVLLKMDYFGFFGGGGIRPTGIANLENQGVNMVQDGGTLQPEDWFRLFWTPSAQANRQFTGWVCNPSAYASNLTVRADAVSNADQAGLFVNNLTTPLGPQLEKFFGHKVTWTNQVPATHVFGGPWNEAVVGLFGAVQALINPYETTAYQKQQTKVRVTALGDFGLRYPTAFSFAKNLS